MFPNLILSSVGVELEASTIHLAWSYGNVCCREESTDETETLRFRCLVEVSFCCLSNRNDFHNISRDNNNVSTLHHHKIFPTDSALGLEMGWLVLSSETQVRHPKAELQLLIL